MKRHHRILLNAAASVFRHPALIQLELTTRCNLKCATCRRPHLTDSDSSINLATFDKINDQIASIGGRKMVAYNFSGLGANLLNKDFFPILRRAKQALFVALCDNFISFNETVSQRVLRNNPDLIVVSLDGATSETFERLRPGADHRSILMNIEALRRIRKSRTGRLPRFHARFVPTTENIHELPDVVALAGGLGIQEVTIPMLYVFSGNEHLRVDDHTLQSSLAQARKIGRQCGVLVDLKPQRPQPVKQCDRGRSSCYVTADGTVLPCCFLPVFESYNGSKARYGFGNVNEASLNTIWNSPRYTAFRQAIRSGHRPRACEKCQLYL